MLKILAVTFIGGALYLAGYALHVAGSPLSLGIALLAVFAAAVMLYPLLNLSAERADAGLRWSYLLHSAGHGRRETALSPGISYEVVKTLDRRYEGAPAAHDLGLKRAMEGVICAVTMVMESRDPYTAGHQRRVAGLARAIAEEMGLSGWQVTGVYVSGLLHDVGKMAVPFEILSKPGKLTQNEMNIIKSHCRIGYEILRKIDFPWPVTAAILQHHERLDGSGYPSGLCGGAVTLEARILGVADVVEAMSSHRPYRAALGLDSAIAEILKGRGVLYDAEAGDACLRLFNHNEAEFARIMAEAVADDYALEMARL
jgi:putative nucleotidyltransferase with HDIG domain